MQQINDRRARTGMLAAGGCAGLALLYNFPPSQYPMYPRCPFHAATGLLCPGCGGTRAIYELLHLNLAGALHFNALVTMLAPLAVIWLVWGSYRLYRYNRFPAVPWPRSIALAVGVVAVLFAMIRDAGIAFVM